MANEKQIAANRKNALRSTGPRTEAGKAVSRHNSLKHGLTAEIVLLPSEDPEQLRELLDALRDKYQPEDLEEELQIERLATLYWQVRRVPGYEATLLRQEERPVVLRPGSVVVDQANAGYREPRASALVTMLVQWDAFSRLSRYARDLSREIERIREQFRKARSEREATSAIPLKASATTPTGQAEPVVSPALTHLWSEDEFEKRMGFSRPN
jgi:hypothetical protein